MPPSDDIPFLELALDLARHPTRRVSPNPRVGAVLVRDGEIVGRGYHQGPGSPHAEVMALKDASVRAQGATLYVNLEPCCHFGLTPPCTEAIIQAGVRRVVASIEDPNPQVSGQGFAALLAAGIDVVVGPLAEAADAINRPYLTWRRLGRPLVTAKWAMTACGHAASRSGESLYLTGPEARTEAHRLRAEHDAVLVGIGTVLQDDPELTVRHVEGPQPLRVVLDSQLRTPPGARIFASRGPVLIYAAEDAPAARLQELSARAGVVQIGAGPKLPLERLLADLAARRITSLLVEGGPTVLGRFFDTGLVDRVRAFVAPLVLGGSTAPAAVGGEGAERPRLAARLAGGSWQALGQDLYFSADVERG